MTQERVLAALGVVALLAIVGGGIAIATGGGDGPEVRTASATSTTAVVVSTSSTTPTSVSTPPVDDGQTSVTVGIICSTPDEAAESLANAWLAGDRAAAGRCATSDAVDTLFQTAGAGADWTFQGCSGDPGVPDCAYTYPGGAAHFTLNGTEAAGWKVVQVGYVAD